MANNKRIKATLRASNKTLEPHPAMELTPSQRKEIAEARKQSAAADTKAALERPSHPTPKQLKALAKSEAIKATRKALKEARKKG